MTPAAPTEDRPLRPRRVPVGALAATLAYAAAAGAALLTGPGAGGLNASVEALSSASGSLLEQVATALPLGYAFGAGMIAAVNPCGFAMLPAYLGLYLGSDEPEAARRRGSRLLRALRVAAAASAGLVVLFGIAGVVLSVATAAVARSFPWVGLAVGVTLVLLGARALEGGTLYAGLGERLADRLGAGARHTSVRGYFAYGLAYGLASLSCTLPIFLTVVGSALTAGGPLFAALEFVLYALGMSAVLAALTLGTALARQTLLARAREVGRYVQPIGALLLVLAGAYIVYYWLTLGGLLAGARAG